MIGHHIRKILSRALSEDELRNYDIQSRISRPPRPPLLSYSRMCTIRALALLHLAFQTFWIFHSCTHFLHLAAPEPPLHLFAPFFLATIFATILESLILIGFPDLQLRDKHTAWSFFSLAIGPLSRLTIYLDCLFITRCFIVPSSFGYVTLPLYATIMLPLFLISPIRLLIGSFFCINDQYNLDLPETFFLHCNKSSGNVDRTFGLRDHPLFQAAMAHRRVNRPNRLKRMLTRIKNCLRSSNNQPARSLQVVAPENEQQHQAEQPLLLDKTNDNSQQHADSSMQDDNNNNNNNDGDDCQTYDSADSSDSGSEDGIFVDLSAENERLFVTLSQLGLDRSEETLEGYQSGTQIAATGRQVAQLAALTYAVDLQGLSCYILSKYVPGERVERVTTSMVIQCGARNLGVDVVFFLVKVFVLVAEGMSVLVAASLFMSTWTSMLTFCQLTAVSGYADEEGDEDEWGSDA